MGGCIKLLFFTNFLLSFVQIMAQLSLGEYSKLQSPQKARLLGELKDAKKILAHKEEEIRQLIERIQRLEDTQERLVRKRRREPRRATRYHMHYGSEEKDWRMQNVGSRRHQHQPPKNYFPFVKLPSLSEESDSNLYLGWEAKVDQIFNLYEIEKDQKVKLASLEFLYYAMQL